MLTKICCAKGKGIDFMQQHWHSATSISFCFSQQQSLEENYEAKKHNKPNSQTVWAKPFFFVCVFWRSLSIVWLMTVQFVYHFLRRKIFCTVFHSGDDSIKLAINLIFNLSLHYEICVTHIFSTKRRDLIIWHNSSRIPLLLRIFALKNYLSI